MANHNDRAIIVTEILADNLLRFWVKVVSRLIKNHKIGALSEDFTESDASFLARAENLYLFIDVIAAKKKVAEDAAHVRIRKIVAADILENRAMLVENFELLRVVGGSRVLAEDNRAFVRLELAYNKLKEGRFANTILTHDKKLLAARELDGKFIVKQRFTVVVKANIL